MTDRIVLHVLTGTRPLTINNERRGHHMQRWREVDDWKGATHEAVLLNRLHRLTLDAAVFTFQPIYPTAVVPDTTAVAPTTKAILDALVAQGILPDDNRFHNLGEFHLPPRVTRTTEVPLIEVTIIPVARHDSNVTVTVPIDPEAQSHPQRGDCTCRNTYQSKQLGKR